MPIVKYKYYDSVNNYASNIFNDSNLLIYKDELKAAALRIGYFSNSPSSWHAANFYCSAIDYAMDDNIVSTNDYLHAETSIKASLSFLVGMSTTILTAEKQFGVELFHLKDPIVASRNNLRSNGKHPDFVGFTRFPDMKPTHLFEAKGSLSRLPSGLGNLANPIGISKAEQQLKSVDIIYRNRRYINSSLSKQVVAAETRGAMIIHNIDPDSSLPEVKSIQIDDEMLLGQKYTNILNLISSNENIYEIQTNSTNLIGVMVNQNFIGMQRGQLETLINDLSADSSVIDSGAEVRSGVSNNKSLRKLGSAEKDFFKTGTRNTAKEWQVKFMKKSLKSKNGDPSNHFDHVADLIANEISEYSTDPFSITIKRQPSSEKSYSIYYLNKRVGYIDISKTSDRFNIYFGVRASKDIKKVELLNSFVSEVRGRYPKFINLIKDSVVSIADGREIMSTGSISLIEFNDLLRDGFLKVLELTYRYK